MSAHEGRPYIWGVGVGRDWSEGRRGFCVRWNDEAVLGAHKGRPYETTEKGSAGAATL